MKKKFFNKTIISCLLLLYALTVYTADRCLAGERGPFTLKELIDMAVEKNPSVAVFNANLEAARAQVLASSAYPNPEIDLEARRADTIDGTDSGGEFSLGIGQPIVWPGKRRLKILGAEASVDVRRYEKEILLVNLRYEVKAAFYRLLFNIKEEALARANLETVNKLLESVKTRVEAGEAPAFELVKARVEHLKAKKELRRAEKKALIAKSALNSLLGGSLPDDYDITGDFPESRQSYNRKELLSIALNKHPLIMRQKKEIEAKGFALEQARRSVFPDITVRGFYDRELDKKTFGAGISVPIPLWYRQKGEILTAGAEKSKAEAELEGLKIEVATLLDQALKSYRIALDQVEVFEKGLLKQAKEALDIAEFSYRQGESGLLDYLDAQRVYRETLLEYTRARYELALSIADIERRLGGV